MHSLFMRGVAGVTIPLLAFVAFAGTADASTYNYQRSGAPTSYQGYGQNYNQNQNYNQGYNQNQYGQGQLSVQGIDAPQTLVAGQSGAWSVHVLGTTGYQGGGVLHYSVVWGDENSAARTANAYYPSTSVQSSGTFTHVYVNPGTYTPVFTVTDSSGHSTQASATTQVTAAYNNGGYNNGGYNNGGYGNGNGSSYCSTYAGYYDRSCYGTQAPATNYPTTPVYNQPSANGCTSYYDRACYVNGRYVGPAFSAGSTYNGPGGGIYTGTTYPGYTGTTNTGSTGYVNPLGGPNGVDYSCYYDRACVSSLNGGQNTYTGSYSLAPTTYSYNRTY